MLSQHDYSDEDAEEDLEAFQEEYDAAPGRWQAIAEFPDIRILRNARRFVAVSQDSQPRIVGCMHCNSFSTSALGDGLTVGTVAVPVEWRRKGVASRIYQAILDSGETLYAGDQTPAGRELWKSIIRHDSRKVIAVMGLETDEVEVVSTPEQYEELSRGWDVMAYFALLPDGPLLDWALSGTDEINGMKIGCRA